MSEPVETCEHHGVPVAIYYDADVNPREDYTPGCTIVAWHRRRNIGDKGFNYHDLPHFGTIDELAEWLREEHGALHIRPLYAYEHSGITISLGAFRDPWDSGQVGLVFVTQQHLDDTGGEPDALMEADVKEWDAYLRGEVYGYVVDEGGPHEESCWGFVGDIARCKSEANAAAECVARLREQERAEREHWAARDVLTVG